jgi:AraC-like DNA-binding protein
MLDEYPTATPFPDARTLVAAAGREVAGRSSELHRHPQGQLLGSSRGLLSIGGEDGVWVVPATQAVWFPPNQWHWASSHGVFEGWTVYVAEAACAGLPERCCTLRTSGLLREAVLRAATWSQRPQTDSAARIASVIIDEIRTLPVESLGLPLPRDVRLQRIARAILEDTASERGLEAWAKWGAVSSRTLSRRFVTETGFTFSAWRQRARLLRALEMLADGQPVGAIALDQGFATASAFIAAFRRMFAESPGAYRQRVLVQVEALAS